MWYYGLHRIYIFLIFWVSISPCWAGPGSRMVCVASPAGTLSAAHTLPGDLWTQGIMGTLEHNIQLHLFLSMSTVASNKCKLTMMKLNWTIQDSRKMKLSSFGERNNLITNRLSGKPKADTVLKLPTTDNFPSFQIIWQPPMAITSNTLALWCWEEHSDAPSAALTAFHPGLILHYTHALWQ